MSETITIPAAGGTIGAYLARPAQGSAPGVVLLGGTTPDAAMRQIADLLAEEGYVTLLPTLTQGDPALVLTEVAVAIGHLRGLDGVAGKVGVVGHAEGGLLAYLAAARTGADVAVGYAPAGVEDYLAEAAGLKAPVLLHLAGDGAETVLAAAKTAPMLRAYGYEGQAAGFAIPGDAAYDLPADTMAWTRTLATLKGVMGPVFDIEELWDLHTYHEFATRDVGATMDTMVPEPHVNHVPTMTGGTGNAEMRRFYGYHFVNSNPEDTRLIPMSRTIGADRVVDEMLFCFTHTCEIDWMLPGVAPTGRYVEIPLVGIVAFRGNKLLSEHIYWDQASVLVQVGLLDPAGLPVSGHEQAEKFMDVTRPSNTLMAAWATSADKPI
ncbi:dienelactone hydrolase family protein [Acidimangrovimonas sediminis]|uniref:dienelactone hydrolase family protein n=1 Tax=Acidimangrovimonas sediminis TaxID=2056283 RepID=UPI000C800C7D|nr:dienelactone hydrolase family protein [Acidimangrovimonas sediminis]